MASAYPEDGEEVFVVGENNNNVDFSRKKSRDEDHDAEALTAEFRHRIGMLDDDEDGDLTDAFKASIGLLGPEGLRSVEEIVWKTDEERDQTISRFKFSKYVKDFFNKGINGSWSKEPISEPLIPKRHELDRMASFAVWVAIQRFMGDAPLAAVEKERSRTPVMSKLYRLLEKIQKDSKQRSNSTSDGQTPGIEKRRSSWKNIFKRTPSEKSKDKGLKRGSSVENGDSEWSDHQKALMDNVPTYEMDLVHFIIGLAVLRREMRDEILCQLCKQLTNNPDASSQHKGWVLMALCSGCFAPSDKLIKSFRCFLKDVGLDYKDYAGYCRRMLRRVETNGMRFHPPNWLEVQAAKVKKYCLLPVSFPDRRIETVEADSATTAGEMVARLCRRVGITDDFGFSVFVSISDKVSSLGSGHDHIMDAIAECEQVVRSKGKKEEEAHWRLYFRKEMFAPWFNPMKDDVAAQIIYKQLCRGVRTGEYPCEADEDVVMFMSQCLYIDEGKNIIPGKIQQDLQKMLPQKRLKDGGARSRESWIQAIMACLEALGYLKIESPQVFVRRDLLLTSMRTWAVYFSGLFEAYRLAGPSLPRNDVVLALNSEGLSVMDEPFRVTQAYAFYELVEGYTAKHDKHRSQTFNVVTIRGDEFVFLSPNAETLARLLTSILDGLRMRSRFAIGLQEFIMQGEALETPFNFNQGDYVEILDEDSPTGPLRDGWVMGKCARTKSKGPFPLDCVYIIPSLTVPPPDFFYMFQQMSSKEFDTLPRKKGAVLLSKEGTVGRHPDHGKDSAV